ncbi:MAG TPA: 50S ribosomal protein L29 [Phnomibacter sp.]|jgi:large subunit ribosomal protein L29|nr:50S ribosomal protein L29 [Phnomibacter sp.]
MSKKIDFNISLRELSIEDLKARINEDEVRLKKLEFAHAITPLENPMSIRALRRDIARMKSELNKRALVG